VRKAAFALAAGSLALAGCGGSGNTSSSGTTTVTAPTQTIRPTTTVTAPTATVTATKPSQHTEIVEIRIEGGKPVGGIERVTVKRGDLIELVVHSDVADEVHLHGYDLHADVEAGGTARIRFQAKIAGVFEAELENRKLQILELTVR
jgi:hypothetical protein